MKTSRTTRSTITLAAALALLPASSAATTTDVDELNFRVFLDDQKIGYHRFRILDRGDRKVVESDADFDVRLLFVPVYSYRHENTEVWRDGCLAQISSRTDANGTRYRVSGERREGVFEIGTREDTRQLDRDCVMSFAYWNRSFLSQRQLLNAQTGEFVDVSVQRLGERALRLAEREVRAEGFHIETPGKEINITVWYAADDGRWLALESVIAGDKVIRYLPTETQEVQVADTRDTFPKSLAR